MKLKKLSHSQRGFTLIELLIVIALTGIIGVAATMSIHQVLTGTIRSNDQNTAINQVRDAGYWLSRDVQMTQNVTPNGTSGFCPLILKWTDWDGTRHQVNYTLENMSFGTFKKLQRQETSTTNTTMIVSQYIDATSTNCSWTGAVLTVNITAQVGNRTESRTFQVKPRPD